MGDGVRPPAPFLVVLSEIVKKDVALLSEEDKQWIKARSSYLTGDERRKFDSFLDTPIIRDPKRALKYKK